MSTPFGGTGALIGIHVLNALCALENMKRQGPGGSLPLQFSSCLYLFYSQVTRSAGRM